MAVQIRLTHCAGVDMLVLSRYRYEGLILGDHLLVTVADMLPEAVKLRIRDTDERATRSFWIALSEKKEIGSEVSLTFLGIQEGVEGPKARVGIEAPRTLPIYRKELWQEFGKWSES